MVLVGAFFSDHGLDENAEAIPIATSLGLDEVKQEVSTRHLGLLQTLERRLCLDPIAGTFDAIAPRRQQAAPSRRTTQAEARTIAEITSLGVLRRWNVSTSRTFEH
jgi:hypothetical protein